MKPIIIATAVLLGLFPAFAVAEQATGGRALDPRSVGIHDRSVEEQHRSGDSKATCRAQHERADAATTSKGRPADRASARRTSRR